MSTMVIFRKWKNSTPLDLRHIIAIFPEIPADNEGWNCQSYEHVGQHGGASPGIMVNETAPAKEEEYKELLKELKQIGYNDLIVRRRFPGNAYETRLQALKEMSESAKAGKTTITSLHGVQVIMCAGCTDDCDSCEEF